MTRGAWIGVGAAAALLVMFVVVVLVIDAASADRIADGIRVGPVDVGGLDESAARAKVAAAIGPTVRRPVTLTYRSERFVLHPAAANVRLDVAGTVAAARERGREGDPFSRVLGGGEVDATVAPRVAYSRSELEAFVDRVVQRVDHDARDADIAWHHGKLQRTHARNGVRTRRSQLEAALVGRLGSASGRRAVAVPVTITERPDRTLEDLAKRYPTVIAVDRDSKQLRLYKRLKLEHKYRIAVGRAGLETSAGRYKIEQKDVNPAWHVPNSSWAGDLAGRTIPPGDPQNPLEARWMGFHDGQGIHGTADIASLGTAASHGCIRMSVPDVKQLFRQVKVGTPVFLQ
jgi:lipoprotein-anchoring transpeptidase ErfK/SrfK